MSYLEIPHSGFSLKTMWSWALGSIIGTIYYIKTFDMSLFLQLDWLAILQYGKLLFFALSGGIATSVGKWIVEAIRNKVPPNKNKPKK